jgi:hypothetical protein
MRKRFLVSRKQEVLSAFINSPFFVIYQELKFRLFLPLRGKGHCPRSGKRKKKTGACAPEYSPVIEQGGKPDEEKSQKCVVVASGAVHGARVPRDAATPTLR